jgi:hypothetical protein
MPLSRTALAVPPEPTSLYPWATRPWASSSNFVLSETLSKPVLAHSALGYAFPKGRHRAPASCPLLLMVIVRVQH